MNRETENKVWIKEKGKIPRQVNTENVIRYTGSNWTLRNNKLQTSITR